MKLPKDRISSVVAEETAKQMTEYKRKSGMEPKQVFIENNAFLFRKPTWEDVQNLLYVRLMSGDDVDNGTSLIIEEGGKEEENE